MALEPWRMNERLVFVVGPSGAGKDSLLRWLQCHPPAHEALHIARRTVTRDMVGDAGTDEPIDDDTFERLLLTGAFAMHWSANGHHYGIRAEQLAPLEAGAWVLVSGSRGHLPEALQAYPGLTVVYVRARPEVLARRLRARGRESEGEVQARLRRAVAFDPPVGALCIDNNHDLDSAGRQLRDGLFSRRVGGSNAP